ncbi:MAG TPA: T9SS type A sorting domain-containing protein [Bacteroidales bacterium]|nr:T9SS type A sorting domain-containing protein [Bacteroidales bacterium]
MKKYLLSILAMFFSVLIMNAQTNCVNYYLSQGDIGIDSETFGVALADFNGDGWKDVVAIHAYDVIEVYFNNGDGTFNTTATYYGDDSWRFGVEIMDIENDGDWDFITSPQNSSFGNGMEIWQNNGTGIFTLKGTILGNTGGYEFAVGDLNDDGFTDIFFPHGDISIMLNNGNGSFTSNGQTNLYVSSPEDVTLNDFDGDGDLDAVVVRNGGSGFVGKYFINDGTGQFMDSGQELSYGCDGVGSGDIDSDGDMDIAIAPFYGHIHFWVNDGFGNFMPGDSLFDASAFYADVILKDINFDNHADIITDKQIWLNDTYNPGSFIKQDFEMTASTHDHAVDDINNDGLPDIYLGRFSSENGDQVFFYEEPQFIYVDSTLCYGDSIFLENEWQTEPGTFFAYAGCDTLDIINLSFYDEINTEVVILDGTLMALAEDAEYQWLDCEAGFQPIEGQTAQTFTPEVTGNYAVEITAYGMCVDTSACYLVVVNGMAENCPENMNVFPNPAGDELNIELNGYDNGTLKMIDFTGKVVMISDFKSSNFALDVSRLPAGIYYLMIHTGNTFFFRDKIIIK